MQVTRMSYVLSLLLPFCFCAAVSAQQLHRIESMKLLTPEVGWAATSEKLFWTTDGSAQWKDITPKLDHRAQSISSAFFLDSSTGWVLLRCGDDLNPKIDDVCFEVASTTDAGQSWSVVHPKIVDPVLNPEDGSGFSLGTFLDFVDPQHGWAILKRGTNTLFSSGVMLRTLDGGRTWTQLKCDLPMAEGFHFTTAKDGWIAGGPERELYVTHDGANSWQKVESLPDMGDRLPVFENERRGLLPVGNVVFATADGGKTWNEERALTDIPDYDSVTIANSVVIAARRELQHEPLDESRYILVTKLSLYILGPDRNVSTNTANVPVSSGGGAMQLSFVDRDLGWVALSDSLLATRDAGRSWVDITPGGPPPAPRVWIHRPTKTVPRGSSPGNAAPSQSSSGNVSMGLGFDTQYVPCSHVTTKKNPCTTAQSLSFMQTWMNSSPYYDIGVYLPGAANHSTDPALNSTWVQGVQQQGWGVIPIWVGLQAPCADQKKLSSFGPTTADASTQGAEEADQAVASAQNLGLSTTIIYKDIENYNTSDTSCSQLVQAFVDGWDSEIHSYPGYAAGVYANYLPINQDIATASTIPDDIWITRTSSPPKVTIWNLGVPEDSQHWPISQRMHQFLTDQPSVEFGGVTLLSGKLDDDIVDAQIVPGVNGTKTSSSDYTNIDCTGALNTYPRAINNMNGTEFINGSGQTGTIVGTYEATNGVTHAYEYTAGACTIIDYAPALVTWAASINNAGTVAGYWEDSVGKIHGYTMTSGGKFTSVDYTGANATYFYGINDAGQVIGFSYVQSSGFFQDFLYYGKKFYPIAYNGASGYTLSYGINGDATVAGAYPCCNSEYDFEEYPVPPSWSGPPTLIPPGSNYFLYVWAVDNANDLVGGYLDPTCSDYCGFLLPPGSAAITLFHDQGWSSTYAFGVNDFGQVVGDYVDATEYAHGFMVAPPQ